MKIKHHGLRYAAITEALELTGGNLAAVRDFSYNRGNRAGEVAKLVATAVTV